MPGDSAITGREFKDRFRLGLKMLTAERGEALGARLAPGEISIDGLRMIAGKDGPDEEVKQHIVRTDLGRHVHLRGDGVRQGALLVQNGGNVNVLHEYYPTMRASEPSQRASINLTPAFTLPSNWPPPIYARGL